MIIKNREFINVDNAVNILDRGFLFGDGIFETCLVMNSKLCNIFYHKERILKGLKLLEFKTVSNDDVVSIFIDCKRLLEENKIIDGLIKIIITRGEGSIGYFPINNIKNNIFIYSEEKRNINITDNKIILGIAAERSHHQAIGNIKTLQAMPYIINKMNAAKHSLFDLIMIDKNGYISETSSANIFWIKNQEILTPSLDCNIVAGTIRSLIINNKIVAIREVKAKAEELKQANEIFLTNASKILIPVNEIRFGNMIVSYGNEKSLIIKNKIIDYLTAED
jgi:branched-subunit amino acid aminotransferase/4-amino-4-deoxychorismate lyase